MGNSISRYMSTWFYTDSGKGLKSGKNTGVIIESKMELNYQDEVHDHMHSQVQSQERDNLPKCQCGSQNFDFGQV